MVTFKVGDRVTWFNFGEEDIGGVVTKVGKKFLTIEWEDDVVLPYPWTKDGKFGGETSDGEVCMRKKTPLEQLL